MDRLVGLGFNSLYSFSMMYSDDVDVIEDCDFEDFFMTSMNFIELDFRNCSFKGMVFVGCVFGDVTFGDSDFDDVVFEGCVFEGCVFDSVALWDGIFCNNRFKDIGLYNCVLGGVIFSGDVCVGSGECVYSDGVSDWCSDLGRYLEVVNTLVDGKEYCVWRDDG